MPTVYLGVGAGISSHLLYFMHGEYHIQAPNLIRLFIFLLPVFALIDLKASTETSITADQTITMLFAAYLLGTLGSIIVYRSFFHPLRRFSGPFGAKVSKFWDVLKAYDSSNFHLMDSLYHKYGDFVRTGMFY